ncbi:MAG: LacI family DNA-binding transcriptional regulator [Bacteroidetes bacterium]|nr:LacI family DNA-binding transcriptional regulator [Bacteroidota bacterium]
MIRCIKCEQVHAITKSGVVHGRQRYYCKDCRIYFSLPESDPSPSPSHTGPHHSATILDIARALNISKSTVSRALQGHKDIKEETRAAVLEMASRLDYQPNLLAKSLVRSKTFTIGIIVPEFMNYFFPTVIIGAQEIASAAGYTVMICQSQESVATEIANTRALLASRVDGVLISMTRETEDFDHFRVFGRHGIPVVFFNRVCETIESSRVYVNDYEGAFSAVEHLIEKGYRRIAHLGGPPNLQLSQNRLNGYSDALKRHGLPLQPELIVRYDLQPENARLCAARLLDLPQRPDAIFCLNDPAAIQALLLAKERGINVPGDLGLVGFSDDPISSIIDPHLTTVRQPVGDMGKIAMQILLEQVEKGIGNYVPEHKTLPTHLVVRESSSGPTGHPR